MSNSMKLLTRTLILLVLMIAGAWLNLQIGQTFYQDGGLASLSFLFMYLVYLLIGITIGSMVNPRFTKTKGKAVYLIPIVIFALIGAQWFFYPLVSIVELPWRMLTYLLEYANLSWTIVGVFLSLAFR